MEKTWRWFGPNDKITLDMLRQIGVEGIVTALNEIPNGGVWPLETILDRKRFIEAAGLHWSVVESLPVSEAIKYAGEERGRLMLGDADKGYNPGYSFHGRMVALAQVEGMMTVVRDELANDWL